MRSSKLTGVVLKTVDFGESDRVVTLLTLERGKVSTFARAARASRRRFGGALEPFTLLDAEVHERRGAELLSLDTVSVVQGFGAIRTDLARIGCAGYACDLARELVRDSEPHAELAALLIDYLRRLDAAPARPAGLRAFELGALRAVGFMPRLRECARCGRPIASSGQIPFNPAEGGVMCDGCARSAPGTIRLSAATASALAGLQSGGLAAADAEPLSRETAREARAALSCFIEHHLGKTLPSRKFLDEIGPLLNE